MEPRDPYDPDAPEGRTEIVETEDAGPRPPWWRERWWLGPLALLLVVGALLAYAFLRDGDEESSAQTTVPDVVGLLEPEARERVTAAGLEVDVTRVESADEELLVLAQEPGGGSQVDEGQTVELTVSNGEGETATTDTTETDTTPPPTDTVTETETVTQTETETETETEPAPEPTEMPSVIGDTLGNAVEAIIDADLLPTSYPVEATEERGTVVAQTPAGGSEIPSGRSVRVNVSLGEGERQGATVPDVRDLEVVAALRECHDAGFTCRTVDRTAPNAAARGRVIGQRPAPGGTAPELSQITIAVAR